MLITSAVAQVAASFKQKDVFDGNKNEEFSRNELQ